jgi:hypothetical protein
VYCGYIGGDRDDLGRDVVVNAAGEAFVAGEAQSTKQRFPSWSGRIMTYNGGDRMGLSPKSARLGPRFCSTDMSGESTQT